MIERIGLVNFKNHADTQIELGRLTALIGPNSSGKTSVLEALNLLTQALYKPLNEIITKDRDVDVWLRNEERSMQIEFRGTTQISLDTIETVPWYLILHISEGSEYGWNPKVMWGIRNITRENTDSSRIWNEALQHHMEHVLVEAIGRGRYLKLLSKNLSSPSYSEEIPPRIESDGSGLASMIAYLLGYEDERMTGIVDSLREVVSDVQKIRVRPKLIEKEEKRWLMIENQRVPINETREIRADELIFDMTGAKKIPAHAVSEGTLLVTALLTILWSPDCPNLVLIDDIEQGLHPKAQRELIAQLREILGQRPELQIVLTSHSPYIVDELEAEEVWLLATGDEGIAHARRLSEHPDAEQALEVLTTGEFWSAEGEDWVVADGE